MYPLAVKYIKYNQELKRHNPSSPLLRIDAPVPVVINVKNGAPSCCVLCESHLHHRQRNATIGSSLEFN